MVAASSETTPAAPAPVPLPTMLPAASELYHLAIYTQRQFDSKSAVLKEAMKAIDTLVNPLENPYEDFQLDVKDRTARRQLRKVTSSMDTANACLNTLAEHIKAAKAAVDSCMDTYLTAVDTLNELNDSDFRQGAIEQLRILTFRHLNKMGESHPEHANLVRKTTTDAHLYESEDLSFANAKLNNVVLRPDPIDALLDSSFDADTSVEYMPMDIDTSAELRPEDLDPLEPVVVQYNPFSREAIYGPKATAAPAHTSVDASNTVVVEEIYNPFSRENVDKPLPTNLFDVEAIKASLSPIKAKSTVSSVRAGSKTKSSLSELSAVPSNPFSRESIYGSRIATAAPARSSINITKPAVVDEVIYNPFSRESIYGPQTTTAPAHVSTDAPKPTVDIVEEEVHNPFSLENLHKPLPPLRFGNTSIEPKVSPVPGKTKAQRPSRTDASISAGKKLAKAPAARRHSTRSSIPVKTTRTAKAPLAETQEVVPPPAAQIQEPIVTDAPAPSEEKVSDFTTAPKDKSWMTMARIQELTDVREQAIASRVLANRYREYLFKNTKSDAEIVKLQTDGQLFCGPPSESPCVVLVNERTARTAANSTKAADANNATVRHEDADGDVVMTTTPHKHSTAQDASATPRRPSPPSTIRKTASYRRAAAARAEKALAAWAMPRSALPSTSSQGAQSVAYALLAQQLGPRRPSPVPVNAARSGLNVGVFLGPREYPRQQWDTTRAVQEDKYPTCLHLPWRPVPQLPRTRAR